MAKSKDIKKKLSYEDAFERLEELTASLEQGNLSLEATLKAFKEGKELLRYCEELLGEAEETLKVLDINNISQKIVESGKEED